MLRNGAIGIRNHQRLSCNLPVEIAGRASEDTFKVLSATFKMSVRVDVKPLA